MSRFLNPQLVTKVSPSDDIEGINNFDIFVIQVFLYFNKELLPRPTINAFVLLKGLLTKKTDLDNNPSITGGS